MRLSVLIAAVAVLFPAMDMQAQTASGKKVLVAYFSHSGNTREMARQIAEATSGDLFRDRPSERLPCAIRCLPSWPSMRAWSRRTRVADPASDGSTVRSSARWASFRMSCRGRPPGGGRTCFPLLAGAVVAAPTAYWCCSSWRWPPISSPVSNLLAPYSAYGRSCLTFFAPLTWGNNLLAYLAERAGSYAFYTVDVRVKGAATLAVAAVTFIVLAVLAWRNGRTPLQYGLSCRHDPGTRVALVFKPRIDARNVTVAAFVPATARRRASTRRRTGSITAAAWPAWTVWGNAARERSPRANPLPAANPLPWNLRP